MLPLYRKSKKSQHWIHGIGIDQGDESMGLIVCTMVGLLLLTITIECALNYP